MRPADRRCRLGGWPGRAGRPVIRQAQGLEKCQGLQRFPQSHFIGEDASEAVPAQKMQPRDALLLVGPQHIFQLAEWRTFQRGLAALLGRPIAPLGGRLDFPMSMLP